MNKISGSNRGFSIIEVLISAAILAVAVIAIITIVRKGRDLQMADKHRQEARAILNARFENIYANGRYGSIQPGISVDTVIIDERPEGVPLTGVLTSTVVQVNVGVSGTQIPTRQVTLSLFWNDFEIESDTITMVKWLCR